MECNYKKNTESSIARLTIDNPKEFDMGVWLTESNFTKDEYSKWFHHVRIALSDIYDYLDGRKSKKECDMYALNDIINVLNLIDIEVK